VNAVGYAQFYSRSHDTTLIFTRMDFVNVFPGHLAIAARSMNTPQAIAPTMLPSESERKESNDTNDDQYNTERGEAGLAALWPHRSSDEPQRW
jgi:hypothetical protein